LAWTFAPHARWRFNLVWNHRSIRAFKAFLASRRSYPGVLGKVGLEIAKEAIEYMMHAGRRTFKARDIEIAQPRRSSSPRDSD